ncbi:MAG TPA: hypothetical protein VKA08_17510 [Balneolales bacterium]|nr:hypothetical protein [Balneolales bacterium]
MNKTDRRKFVSRFLLVVIITMIYLGPWHRMRYYFAKEWFMPKVITLNTGHFHTLTVGGYGTGVGFELHLNKIKRVFTYRYKVAGGWFLLLPLVVGILMGMNFWYAIELFLFHVTISFLNALLFYVGAAYTNILLAVADLSCYYLVPAVSLAVIPFLIVQKRRRKVLKC